MTEKHIFIEIQGLLKNYEGFYAKATEIFAPKGETYGLNLQVKVRQMYELCVFTHA